MAQSQVIYEKDSVYIHINVSDSRDKDAHIPGIAYLMKKPEGTYIEWKSEEIVSLDGHSDQDWAVIGSVGYKPDRNSDSGTQTSKADARKKYDVSFDVLDLKSFKRNAPNHGWAYIVFILKDGTTFPALHFHSGGSKALLKELEKYVHIKRSPNDPRLFIVQEHDPEMLSKSFDELHLFTDSSNDLVSKFIRDPYNSTLGGFAKVTNILKDALFQTDAVSRPKNEVVELLQDSDILGMEINNRDEPGFDIVTKTKLPNRPEVKRDSPLTSQEWSLYMDKEGKIKDLDSLKDKIFKGGIDQSIRVEVWKFLLSYYEWNSTYKSRTDERKRKVDDYFRMKLQWKTISAEQERRFSMLRDRKCLIEKDVTRTDRTHTFFEGEGNPNLQVLNDILMTYCMYNFDLGYVQGMSDLLSPILVVMENEVDAFWCFAGLLDRVSHNFDLDQNGMKEQLSQLHKLMQFSDPELCSYLESHDSGNFYFCFRWLLILFKREFNFKEVKKLWEIIWTDRPCKNFHLLICLAILDNEKSTLMENHFGFTEILKHINDICFSINLDETLKKAESIYLQLKKCKKLPQPLKEILGLEEPSSNSASSSSYSTPACTPSNSSHKLELYIKDNLSNGNSRSGSQNGTVSNSPEDTSIEILNEHCDNAVAFHHH